MKNIRFIFFIYGTSAYMATIPSCEQVVQNGRRKLLHIWHKLAISRSFITTSVLVSSVHSGSRQQFVAMQVPCSHHAADRHL